MMDFPKHIVAACGLVRKATGQVLLVRTTARGWDCPGGQVEEGESLIEGLKREIREEAGVEVEVTQLAGIYSNVKSPSKVILAFLCEWISGELKSSDETPEVIWVNDNEVLGLITHPVVKDRTRDMLNFAGQVIYRAYSTEPYEMMQERFI